MKRWWVVIALLLSVGVNLGVLAVLVGGQGGRTALSEAARGGLRVHRRGGCRPGGLHGPDAAGLQAAA